MLASRVLPPIVRPSSPLPTDPVATFFNIPRRYVRSNMQVGNSPSHSPIEDGHSRSLRKSSRIHDTRTAPASSPVQPLKEDDFPVPASPRGSRKRVAPLEEVVNGDGSIDVNNATENRSPRSASSGGSGESSPHVCLCQPEPKIPRPRNAFILYRQHHQQAIIARNRGINNPDISKIIGEQWKAESEETKKVWQTLAQEEKVRHHEQYPDYRYQPRRVGKPGSSPLNPSGQHTTVDKYRCPRCGGRSIKTPTSPFIPSPGTPSLPPPTYTEGSTPTTRYLPMMSNLSLKSPNRRRGRGGSSLSSIQVPPIREEPAMYSPATPGMKRRRFEYDPPPSSSLRRDSSYYQQYARRDSLPPIQVRYSPPNSASMPHIRTPRDGRRASQEISPQNTGQQEHGTKNVEEILMTFPYQNKIKLLGRISLPYKESVSVHPANQVRGAIIAVEGDDLTAVKELSEWLNERLANDADASYQSRIIEPPKLPEEESVNFEDYLDLIKEWHVKSKEMIQYITTPLSSVSSSPETLMSDKDSKKESTVSTDRKDSASPPQSSIRTPSISTSTSITTSGSIPSSTKPIIILPTFQLQASTTYAARIPVQDAYSTTDHWQWMATLWRGTVGPDLTIYVKTHEKDAVGAKPEMDDAVRCLTVSKEREGRFSDAHLRRVGFEVGEFVKGMGGKGV